ncbi:uncharacterized protein LOC144145876 isoform X1 [Haemaphysalis longicornis]
MGPCRKEHHQSCAALWCRNTGRNSSAKFFAFPKDSRFEAWMRYVNRPDWEGLPKERIRLSHRLCSDHFAVGDFADPARTRLLGSAVPWAGVRDVRVLALASDGPRWLLLLLVPGLAGRRSPSCSASLPTSFAEAATTGAPRRGRIATKLDVSSGDSPQPFQSHHAGPAHKEGSRACATSVTWPSLLPGKSNTLTQSIVPMRFQASQANVKVKSKNIGVQTRRSTRRKHTPWKEDLMWTTSRPPVTHRCLPLVGKSAAVLWSKAWERVSAAPWTTCYKLLCNVPDASIQRYSSS